MSCEVSSFVMRKWCKPLLLPMMYFRGLGWKNINFDLFSRIWEPQNRWTSTTQLRERFIDLLRSADLVSIRQLESTISKRYTGSLTDCSSFVIADRYSKKVLRHLAHFFKLKNAPFLERIILIVVIAIVTTLWCWGQFLRMHILCPVFNAATIIYRFICF